jgi:hypothetical protein
MRTNRELLLAALLSTLPAHAQDPGELVLPELPGARPWTEKPVLDDPGRFHIAIMTDRTGGHRPGVWMKAVGQLNLLRPDFVMSVGDLIEGYSHDDAELDRQWREFQGFVDRLDMRFFFVAGNHDVSNAKMHALWRERYGPEWYSFDYRGVHFLCLSSEDPVTRIGDAQMAFVERDLAASASARWTLVFLHKPLWVTAERDLAEGKPDSTGWKAVERLLAERPHTVFAGHVHHYVQYRRNGAEYYSLATTGGGSRLRGVPYGEFDHVVWLTMERDGPRIANLLLDGVLAPDAVTEAGIARFRKFLDQAAVEVLPIFVDDRDTLAGGAIELRLRNGFDRPIRLRGSIQGLPLSGLSLEPHELELVAAAGQERQLDVRFRLAEPVELDRLGRTELVGRLETLEETPLFASVTVPALIDRRHAWPERQVEIDGDLGEWGELELHTRSEPLVLGNAAEWQGPGDCSARFALARGAASLHFAAVVRDDRVVAGDRITLACDTRPFATRLRDPKLGAGTFRAEIAPVLGGESTIAVRGTGGRDPGRTRVAVRARTDGYTVEAELPLALFAEQAADPESFQLDVVLSDHDAPNDRGCAVVWRGTRDTDRNTGFAHFFRR